MITRYTKVKPYSHAGVPTWLKWVVIIVCLVILISLIYFTYLYHTILQDKTDGFAETQAYVLKNTNITEIEDITRFQADQGYTIVLGKAKDQKEQYVFVPEKKGAKTVVIDAKKTKEKQDIINQWQKQCDQCKLVKVTPAMIDEKPLWEVTYWQGSDNYIMDYLSIYDGDRFEQIRLKSMFN